MIWCDACVNNYCDDSKCDGGRNCQARLCTPPPRLNPGAQAALDGAVERLAALPEPCPEPTLADLQARIERLEAAMMELNPGLNWR